VYVSDYQLPNKDSGSMELVGYECQHVRMRAVFPEDVNPRRNNLGA
jgi:hypothetical protein